MTTFSRDVSRECHIRVFSRLSVYPVRQSRPTMSPSRNAARSFAVVSSCISSPCCRRIIITEVSVYIFDWYKCSSWLPLLYLECVDIISYFKAVAFTTKRKWNRWRLLANTTSLCITHVSHVPVKAKTTTTRSQLTLLWWIISILQSGYKRKLIMHKHRMDRMPSWCATCHQKTQLTMTSRLRCDLDLLLHTHNMSGCTLFQENEKSKPVNVSWCAEKATGSGLALTALSIGWTGDDTMKTTVNVTSNITFIEQKHACWTELLMNGDGRTDGRTDGRVFSSPRPVVGDRPDEAAPLDVLTSDSLNCELATSSRLKTV